MESLVESGRQRLEGLIDAALSDGTGSSTTVGGGGAEGGVGRAGAELMRLWEEGKEQLSELAGKGGEVCLQYLFGSCVRGAFYHRVKGRGFLCARGVFCRVNGVRLMVNWAMRQRELQML